MQLQEFYETVGGDYAGTSQRVYNDALILRVVKMYPSDPNFDKLHHALGAQDWEEAFRAAHTLTGVGQNLGFTRLYEASSDLTEALRGGRPLMDRTLWERVETEHQRVLNALTQLN